MPFSYLLSLPNGTTPPPWAGPDNRDIVFSDFVKEKMTFLFV
jgi:hypothetical protein